MTDVRLTAVNPEDSQVYPVACNDKGELLLDPGTSPSGDLDVTGNLTVAGNTTGGGGWQSSTPTKGGYRLHAEFGQLSLSTTGSGLSGNFIQCQNTTDRAFQVAYDGSATFAGGVTADLEINQGNVNTASPSAIGVKVGPGYVAAQRAGTADPTNYTYAGFYGATKTFEVSADGGATFAGGQTKIDSSGWIDITRTSAASNGLLINEQIDGGTKNTNAKILSDGTATFNGGVDSSNFFRATQSGYGNAIVGGSTTYGFQILNSSSTPVIRLEYNGSANFSGNVTAPNINFKLAPATVAAMPAPLIDEGFASNNEVDLLSVLMEMKLQIRDLNAFMQRSTQDDPET